MFLPFQVEATTHIRLRPQGEDSGSLFSAAETPEETAWMNQAD